MKQVFISHASSDVEVSKKICDVLERKGVSCWIAPRDVRPGHDYGEEIIRGISESSALILILSEQANRSKFVKREVERAVSHGKPVLPLRISDIEPSRALELFISGTHWIDVWTPPIEQYVDKLVAAIHAIEGSHHATECEDDRQEPKVDLPQGREDSHPMRKSKRKRYILLGTFSILGIILAAWVASSGRKVNAPDLPSPASVVHADQEDSSNEQVDEPTEAMEETAPNDVSSILSLLGVSTGEQRLNLIQQNRAYLPEKITQEQFRRLTGKLYVNNNPEDAKVYEDMLLLLQDRLPDELTFRESYNLVAVAQKETRSRLLKILSENLPEQISVDDFASLVSFRGSNNDDSNRYIEALDLFFDRLPSKLSGRDFFYLLRAIKDGELLHAQIKRFSPRLESINAKHARILTDDLVPRESADHWKQKIMETLLPKIENP